MKVTQDLIDNLASYKKREQITNAELGSRLGITKTHIGRIMSGETKEVKDELANEIKNLLGRKLVEQAAYTPTIRGIIEIAYKGKAMRPTIDKGQTIMAAPLPASSLNDGDIVACCFNLPHESGQRTVVGYCNKLVNGIKFTFEDAEAEPCKTTFAKIDWIAKVLLPLRSIKVGD